MSLTLSAVGLCVLIAAWTLWFKKAFRQALPRNLLGFAVSMFLGLGLVASSFFFEVTFLSGLIALPALALGLFWFASAALGGQKTNVPKIAVGQPLPEFSALNEDASMFRSGEMEGSPYLLKFFRGHW